MGKPDYMHRIVGAYTLRDAVPLCDVILEVTEAVEMQLRTSQDITENIWCPKCGQKRARPVCMNGKWVYECNCGAVGKVLYAEIKNAEKAFRGGEVDMMPAGGPNGAQKGQRVCG